MTGRRLASFVHVGGQVYGPDSDVPDEVAALVTNPKAWAGPVKAQSPEPEPEPGPEPSQARRTRKQH